MKEDNFGHTRVLMKNAAFGTGECVRVTRNLTFQSCLNSEPENWAHELKVSDKCYDRKSGLPKYKHTDKFECYTCEVRQEICWWNLY